MKKINKSLCSLSVITLIILQGCSAVSTPKPISGELSQGVEIITNTAEVTNTVVNNKNSVRQICAQPTPDVTFNSSKSGALNLSLINKGSDGESSGASNGGVEMNGRSPAVLITRELFYRLCETYTNLNLSKDEVTPLFQKVIDVVSQGWLAEASKTNVNVTNPANPGPASSPTQSPVTNTTTPPAAN